LFAQAEGRDLWQSRWLLPDLLAQAVFAGAGMLAIGLVRTDGNGPGRSIVALGILVGAVAHVALTLAELLGSHETKGAEVAARIVLRGRYAPVYWAGTVAVGVVAAALALTASFTVGTTVPIVVAGVLAQIAVISYEVVYVRAGQEVPLS
jgi:Ni/Fe-hydrogenase subunit HybB-like protein